MASNPSRDRDRNRKYDSGYEKAKKRKRLDKKIRKSQNGSFLKFLTPLSSTQNEKKITNGF